MAGLRSWAAAGVLLLAGAGVAHAGGGPESMRDEPDTEIARPVVQLP